jgi:hypothetical protein
MPQIYLVLAVLSIILGKFKDIFSLVNLSDDTKKIIKWLLYGVVLYYVYKLIQHQTNKDKALGDENGSLAIELHNAIYSQAFNLHVPFLGDYHIGNGDENAVLLISEKIKDVTEVSKYYKDLYGIDLYTDLVKILDSEQLATFNANVQKRGGGAISDPSNPSNPSTNPTIKKLKLGDAVYCKNPNNVNIRSAKDPSKILYQVNKNTTYLMVFGKDKGYIGDFVKERNVTINGKIEACYEIDIPYSQQMDIGNINYGLNGLIAKRLLN